MQAVPDVRVRIYESKGAPEADKMPHSKNVPATTVGRAALVELMNRYVRGLLGPTISLLEVHKLMAPVFAPSSRFRLCALLVDRLVGNLAGLHARRPGSDAGRACTSSRIIATRVHPVHSPASDSLRSRAPRLAWRTSRRRSSRSKALRVVVRA